MKLLHRTGRYYLLYSTLAFVLGGVILVFVIRWTINREIDEQLLDDKARLQVQLSAMDSLPSTIAIGDHVLDIEALSEFYDYEQFSDTLQWSDIDQEQEPIRRLDYHEMISGKPYRISIRHSKLENEEFITSILLNAFGIFALLLLAINLVNRYVALRLWKPFYKTIEQIQGFNFNRAKPFAPITTDIEEFSILARALESMTAKLLNDYRALKRFAENASHEIQSPLAIIKSKIELLIQGENLSKEQLDILTQVDHAGTRLSKLTQALLLLTRIENRQYTDDQEVNLKEIIEIRLDQLKPFITEKKLTVAKYLDQVSTVMDPVLAEVLISNLVGNAVKHCITGSQIEVMLKEGQLSVGNQGSPLTVPTDALFDRFSKGDDAAPSLGLGLAIVKEICNTYDFDIKYELEDGWHRLILNFS